MSGSRLGRGRGGRLAVYGGCCIVLILLVFLYRAATTEMERLREIHVQCSHQQEALTVQLQVIIECKVRLEKSLAEKTSANAALQRELQERATREKSLRDKDSVEAMQRYNSLQQAHNLLKSEHQDLREECNKQQKQALDDSTRLETTLQELRGQIGKAKEDKEKSLEHLKNEYLRVDTEKSKLEKQYNELLASNGNTDSTIEHLKKEVFELKRELEETKLICKAPSDLEMINFKASVLKPQPSVMKSPSLDSAINPSQQQNNSVISLSKVSTTPSSIKSSINSVSTSIDKSPNETPVKLVSRVKLPVGVVPIPKMDVPKTDREDLKRIVDERTLSMDKRKIPREHPDEQKALDNDDHDVIGGRHIGEQILERQGNPAWYKVRPGVQEIGDEPNNLRRIIPDLDEGVHLGPEQGGDDDYGNIDNYKEAAPNHNDIRLDEGEEEEGEDEEDYQNNPRAVKHE